MDIRGIRELHIYVDDEVKRELKQRLFQNSLFRLVGDELEPKDTPTEDFYKVCLKGLESGNLNNSYQQMKIEVFGDKIGSKEPAMIVGCKKYCNAPLPVLYSLIQQDMYKWYGEFE